MTILVKAHAARAPKNKYVGYGATLYAAILVVLLVAQLFTYEDFPSIIASFWLTDSLASSHLLAALIIVAELFAIPFLLRMKLSVAMRWLSTGLGWLVAGFWLFIGIWLSVTVHAVTNTGLLGSAIELAPGPWLIVKGLFLVALSAWVTWGLWPGKRATAAKKRK